MLVVSWFIGTMLCFFVYCYLFCKFSGTEKYEINIKMILFAIGMAIIFCFCSGYGFKYDILWLRPLIMHAYTIVAYMSIYKQKFLKCLLVILCILIVSSISELIFSIVAVLLLKVDGESFILTWYGYSFSNTLILIISVILGNILFVKRAAQNIINWYNKNQYKSLMIFVVLCIIIFTFLLYNNFISLLPSSVLWLTNMFCIGVIVFVISYFREKANNNRIVFEYDQLLDYVKKYERVVEDKSKRQHEYKNQLILIKSMLNKNNKKAIAYIDDLYKEEKDDNDVELLKKLQYLPSGGLKGLIYYKIEEIQDKKINVFVDISPKVKNLKINKKIDKNLKDMSRIIGVYLDNATEACMNSKEKYIVLEIYIDGDEWVFGLSNTYDGKIDIRNMDKEGYTTKGDGKGYGLSLAKDILNRNSDLRQERELKGIYFVQRLYMKK